MRIVWANRTASESVGADSSQIVGRHCYEVWHERTEPCAGCPVMRARDTREPQDGESKTPDGRTYLIKAFPILHDGGEVVGVVEISREITEHRRIEEAYRALVDHSLQGIGIFKDGRMVLANPALSEILGRPLDALYALSTGEIIRLVHPDERDRLVDDVRAHLEGRPASRRQSYRILRPDGSVRSLETLVQVITWEDGPALQVAYWDVTDAKETAEAYRVLVDNSLQGLTITQDGRTVFSNPAALAIVGYTAEEVYAASPERMLEMVHPGDRQRVVEGLAARFGGRDVDSRQVYRILRKGGETRWVDTWSEIIEYKGRPALQTTMSDITDRIRAEEAHRVLVEQSLQGLAIIQDGRLAFANSVISQMIGFSREELYSFDTEQLRQLVPVEDRESTSAHLRGHMEGRPDPGARLTRIKHKDGSLRWLEIMVQGIEYRGRPAMQVAFRDVTEAKDAELAYDKLVELSLQGLAIVQGDRIVFANSVVSDISGRSLDEISSLAIADILEMVHPEDREDATRNLKGRIEGRDVPPHQQYRLCRSDGGLRWVELLGGRTTYKGRPAVQLVFHDITGLKSAEDRLRKERDRAQTYLDVAGVMLIAFDMEANVTMINRRGCEILEGSEEEIVGKNWFETFLPRDQHEEILEIFRKVVDGGEDLVARFENPILTCRGEEKIISWTNTVFRDERGTVVGALSSGEDVTERRRAEEERSRLEAQLQQAQKLEAIGTLAGGVAHEINNPVNITMNFARLIQDRVEAGGDVHEFAQEIVDEGERMSSIVKKLLSFARQERERHSPARIVDIVDSTVTLIKMVMRKDQISISVDVEEDLPAILCRSQQIQQVLMNLLTNARDALNQRYPDPHPDKVIRIGSHALTKGGERWIRTTVEDRGAGIQPGALGRVFDPFFTTKTREQGTGLGLSVSYGIVKEHRGELWAESEPGSYTRFHMDLRVDNGWRLEEGG